VTEREAGEEGGGGEGERTSEKYSCSFLLFWIFREMHALSKPLREDVQVCMHVARAGVWCVGAACSAPMLGAMLAESFSNGLYMRVSWQH
jgi:hypothetical protein